MKTEGLVRMNLYLRNKSRAFTNLYSSRYIYGTSANMKTTFFLAKIKNRKVK